VWGLLLVPGVHAPVDEDPEPGVLEPRRSRSRMLMVGHTLRFLEEQLLGKTPTRAAGQ
jgi:hypothetical protein